MRYLFQTLISGIISITYLIPCHTISHPRHCTWDEYHFLATTDPSFDGIHYTTLTNIIMILASSQVPGRPFKVCFKNTTISKWQLQAQSPLPQTGLEEQTWQTPKRYRYTNSVNTSEPADTKHLHSWNVDTLDSLKCITRTRKHDDIQQLMADITHNIWHD